MVYNHGIIFNGVYMYIIKHKMFFPPKKLIIWER